MPQSVKVCCSKYAKLKGDSNDVRQIPVKDLINVLKTGQIPEVYELIPNDIPIKPYFDLDIHSDSVDNFEELYENKEGVLEEHLDFLKKDFEDAEFAVSESNRPNKISYHITIPNYRTEMLDLYNYSRGFTNAFDRAVYNSDMDNCPRKFRTIYSSKGPFKLEPKTHLDRLDEHFVTVVKGNAREFYKDITPPSPGNYIERPIRQNGGTGLTLGDVLIQNDRVDYKEWIKIGVSMLLVFKDDERAYAEFLKYSKRHHRFDLGLFNKTFDDLKKRQYKRGGWSVLRKWTPKEHWDLIEDVPLPMVSYDYDIAEFIYKTFSKYSITTTKSNNRSAGSSKGVWYRFINHRWQETCDVEVKNEVITEYLYGEYESLIKGVERSLATCCEDEAKDIKKRLKEIRKTFGELKGVTKVNKILDALFNKYYKRDFMAKLNQNPYLLGFTNGVYDFKDKAFRPGQEEDYISLTTGYDFKEDRNYREEERLKKIIMEICCERQDLYDTLTEVLARCLIGDNSTNNQLFYCLYGRGSNGKSTLASILKESLGDYHAVMPTSLLSQKSQRADACNADVAKLIGKRVVVCSETEQDVPINISTVKNMSGEEVISYRNLYESVRESKITWSVFLLTNDKLRLPSNDYGTTRRFRYLPFKAKFLDPHELQEAHEGVKCYLKDRDIMKNLKEIRGDFMNLLIHTEIKDRIEFPQWIIDDTMEMIKSQDKLQGILDTYFIKAEATYGISWKDLQEVMKQDPTFRQMRFNSKSALLEQVEDRLPYARLNKDTTPSWFISTDIYGNETRLRRRTWFMGIRVKPPLEEGEEGEEEADTCLV